MQANIELKVGNLLSKKKLCITCAEKMSSSMLVVLQSASA